jgi:hypothetical protein
MTLTSRLATDADLARLGPLVEAAIDELQRGFLDEEQIRASHLIMGVDRQLVEDGTYYVVEADGGLADAGAGAAAPPSTAATTAPAGAVGCSTRARSRRGSGPCTPVRPSCGAGSGG